MVGRDVKRVDEVCEHQRHKHKHVRNPLVYWSTCWIAKANTNKNIFSEKTKGTLSCCHVMQLHSPTKNYVQNRVTVCCLLAFSTDNFLETGQKIKNWMQHYILDSFTVADVQWILKANKKEKGKKKKLQIFWNCICENWEKKGRNTITRGSRSRCRWKGLGFNNSWLKDGNKKSIDGQNSRSSSEKCHFFFLLGAFYN